jgi:hypothetical protein
MIANLSHGHPILKIRMDDIALPLGLTPTVCCNTSVRLPGIILKPAFILPSSSRIRLKPDTIFVCSLPRILTTHSEHGLCSWIRVLPRFGE